MRTDMAYDTRGQLQKTTGYGTVDAAGNGVADASRSITQYVYDQAGLLLKTILRPQRHDAVHLRRSRPPPHATDATGQLTLTQYDDANAKTLVTLASGLEDHQRVRSRRPARVGHPEQRRRREPGPDTNISTTPTRACS